MRKIFFLLLIAGVICMFVLDETYDFTLRLMDYEYTCSLAALFVCALLFFGFYRLIRKPFVLVASLRTKWRQKQVLKKESFLISVVRTVLDKNDDAVQSILPQAKSLFGKDSAEYLVFQGLFNPSQEVFEKLSDFESTELAGLRGLYLQAKSEGDIETQEKLLQRASTKHPNVSWIATEQFQVSVLQNDWDAASAHLETLKKYKWIADNVYRKQKACVLYHLKQYKTAFDLDSDNPAIGIACAHAEPKKTQDILRKVWENAPCKDVFEAYYATIENESADKQMKLVEKLIAKNQTVRASLIAKADVAMKNHLWGVAKETLQIAMDTYPLTRQVALMMAEVEKAGWHHDAVAQEWLDKANTLQEQSPWMCSACHRQFSEWDSVCPACNSCGTVTLYL